MARATSTGTCAFCHATFGKSAMTRHLASCKLRPIGQEASSGGRRSRIAKAFHIVATGRYAPMYWMHLEASSNATLEDLDEVLRDEWLECCGHLSAFNIRGRSYSSDGPDEEWGSGGEDMDVKFGKLLSPGMAFSYEYDFGTTTELIIKVASEREGPAPREPIKLLARNNPPEIVCSYCERPATQVCSQCVWDGAGWVCDECAREHECGENMLLPAVNSPRVGMCGYAG